MNIECHHCGAPGEYLEHVNSEGIYYCPLCGTRTPDDLEDVNEMSMKPISIDDYAESVLALVKVALTDTGQSRFAAQVILSAYNGNNWQLDITDLCGLDTALYHHALNVIRGRVELQMEPHELVENGDKVFLDIQRQHQRYHIANRWKRQCPKCDGYGVIYDDDENQSECKACHGTGLSSALPEAPVF